MLKINYPGWGECKVEISRYAAGGAPRIQLYVPMEECPDIWEPLMTASVNFPHSRLPAAATYIKDYSENEGVTEVLQAEGVIESDPVAAINSGFISAFAYRLTGPALDALREFDEEQAKWRKSA